MDWPVEPDPDLAASPDVADADGADDAQPKPKPKRRRRVRRWKGGGTLPASDADALQAVRAEEAVKPTETDEAVGSVRAAVIEPTATDPGGAALGWGELVREQHGERRALADVKPPESQAWVPPELDGATSVAAPDIAADRIRHRIDEIEPRVVGVESELESSVAVLSHQIGRLDDKLASAEARLADEVSSLRVGIDALQSAFSDALTRLEAERGAPAPAPEAIRSTAGGSVALNAASFEDLRGLGLSVTQAARVIAFRDTRGGFTEIDQLREIRGLGADDLRLLLDRTTL